MIFKRLLDFILGSRDYVIPEPCAESAARILVVSGADLRSMRMHGGNLKFTLPLRDCKAVERILTSRTLSFEVERERGLTRLIRRYRRRLGIPIGAFVMFLILVLSERFIWTVDVTGNENFTDREVIERMESHGFRVGSYIPSLDLDRVHMDFLLEDEAFSWVAVNIYGTHAVIEVRETTVNVPVPDESAPHNIVAAEDGVISTIDIFRGQRIAEPGDFVREGQLLASGVVESAKGLKLLHARGVVMAETERELSYEIPLRRLEKSYTGREFCEISAEILGFSVNIFRNTGNLPPMCDTIDREHRVVIFGVIELPIVIRSRIFREFTECEVEVPESQARSEAYASLRFALASLDGELLSRSVTVSSNEECVLLTAKVKVLTNIAREMAIGVG